jgi:hypothetical protein
VRVPVLAGRQTPAVVSTGSHAGYQQLVNVLEGGDEMYIGGGLLALIIIILLLVWLF